MPGPINRRRILLGGSGGLPSLSAGYTYLIDGSGNYLLDASGNYLIGPVTTALPTDVFIIAGQSNAVGDGRTMSAILDIPHANVLQYTQAATLISADDPLDHFTPSVDGIGFAMEFARQHTAATGRLVILIPCGQAGTGFSGSHWNSGNSYFNSTVTRANAVIALNSVHALNSNHVLAGMLWHQGETDALAGWTQVQYANAFDAMAAAFRAQITGASAMKIVVGGMSPDWVAADPSFQPVQDALAATPGRIANAAFASAAGLTGNSGDEIHLDAVSQRTFGGRYLTAYQSI